MLATSPAPLLISPLREPSIIHTPEGLEYHRGEGAEPTLPSQSTPVYDPESPFVNHSMDQDETV